MEEILASIRRIIEDSDPLQADDGDAGSENAPFREELRTVTAPASPANDADESRRAWESVSTRSDDVSARLDETSDKAESPTETQNKPAFSAPQATDAFDALRMEPPQSGKEATPDEGGNREAREAMQHQQPPTDDSTHVKHAAPGVENGMESKAVSWQKPEEAEPAQQPAEAEKREDRAQPASLMPRTKAGAQDTRTSILSETSGRKVAAAFGELNEAYEASRRKSLADAAEEMLQPMLQEWLDNNLPQLVERLVREEIERIARGPSTDS